MRDGNIAGILGRPVAQGLFLDPAQLPPVKKRGDQRGDQVGDGFRPEGGRRTEGGGQSEQGREIDSLSEEGQGEGKLHHPHAVQSFYNGVLHRQWDHTDGKDADDSHGQGRNLRIRCKNMGEGGGQQKPHQAQSGGIGQGEEQGVLLGVWAGRPPGCTPG